MTRPSSITLDHRSQALWLVDQARHHDGLAPVDLDKFWADQAIANSDPFGAHIPQVAMGLNMWWECAFDELGVADDYWRYENDLPWQMSLNKAYNDRAEKIIGTRPLTETAPDATRQYPPVKRLHDLFEAKNVWHDRSWWLQQSADTESELAALLDHVEGRLTRLAGFVLPPEWESEKQRLLRLGIKPPLYKWQREPCTFATSVYGAENMPTARAG
jgi:hypothetical protein